MFLDLPIQKLQYATWAQQAEEYVLQNMACPRKGRGRIIEIEHKELLDSKKPWTWKRGAMAFWGQFISILQHLHRAPRLNQKNQGTLQRLIWSIPQHWQGDGDGQEMQEQCQQYSRNQDDDEHNLVLQLAMHQEQLAKDEALNDEAEEYRHWLHTGYSRGFRALFRTLKQDQTPYLRPFQDKPLDERVAMRIQQWKEIWATQEEPVQIPNMQEICRRGQEAAQALPPLHPGHMMKVAKGLSQKAAGLDAISNDLLRNLPWEGHQDLARVLTELERTGELPQQWLASLVVLIPKSKSIERPIALVSAVYRFWCKLRQPELRRWQKELQVKMPWERAKPGNECLHIALNRLLRAPTNVSS